MALFLTKSGSYTGTGLTGLVIPIGFPGDTLGIVVPRLVIVANSDNVSNTTSHCMKWSGLTDSVIGFQFKQTTGITALNAGSFTVGAGASVNTTDTVHYWTAFADVDDFGEHIGENFSSGVYTGNGVDNRAIPVGFAPDFVAVRRQINNAEDAWAHYLFTVAGGGDDTICKARPSDDAVQTNMIKTLTATGFTVGTTASVNLDTADYTWLAIKRKTGFIAMGSYEGNDTDGRDIVQDDPFQPEAVLLQGVGNISGAVGPIYRSDAFSGDTCIYLPDSTNDNVGGGGVWADGIQAFNTNGFEVGDGTGIGGAAGYGAFVNDAGIAGNGEFYAYMSFKSELLPAGFNPGGFTEATPYILPTTPYTFYKSAVALSERLKRLRLR